MPVKLDSMPQIPIEGNRIKIVGAVSGAHIRRIYAAFLGLLKQNNPEIIFDLTDVTDIHSPQALAFILIVAKLRELGATVRAKLPRAPKINALFCNANWANLLDPKEFEVSPVSYQVHFPTLQYRTGHEQYNAVNKIMEYVLSNVHGLNKNYFTAFEWAINEITDNVLNHADSSIGGLVHLEKFLGHQRVIHYIVCDAGLGIPKTLRDSHPEYTSDESALKASVQEGVTRNLNKNAGNGLYGSLRIARVSEAHFNIESGKARLTYSSSNSFTSLSG